jgi:hypothetical protein
MTEFLRGYKVGSDDAIEWLKDALDLHEDHEEEIIAETREHIDRIIASLKGLC